MKCGYKSVDPHAYWIVSEDGLSRINPAPDSAQASVPNATQVVSLSSWVKSDDNIRTQVAQHAIDNHSMSLTPRSDELEQSRSLFGEERSGIYGDALALCRQLELELSQARQTPLFSTREEAARWRFWKPWLERRVNLPAYETQFREYVQPVDDADNLYDKGWRDGYANRAGAALQASRDG